MSDPFDDLAGCIVVEEGSFEERFMGKHLQNKIASCAFRESNDAIFVIEPRDYRVVDLNPAALRLTALGRKVALKQTFYDLFKSDHPDLFSRLFSACDKTGRFQPGGDHYLHRSDGGTVVVNLSVSRIHTKKVAFGLVVAHDVSERRTAQDRLDHLLGLINDLLDLSEIEHGRIRITPTRCSPRQIVSDVVTFMEGRAEAKGLQLLVVFEGLLPKSILTDEVRLRQILINLIGNAIKFGDRGAVTIRLVCDWPQAEIDVFGSAADRELPSEFLPRLHFEVSGEGVGMGPETIEGLFQPFHQAQKSLEHSHQGRAGLALVISARLAERLGGSIEVKSEPNQGSTFRFTVPSGPLDADPFAVKPGAQGEDRQSALSLLTAAPRGQKGRPGAKRVLLAEDNPDNRRAISMLLSHAGHHVTLACNGQEAFEIASAAERNGEPFDTILMDMQMPVVDGFQATRMLRDAGYSKRILALTAYAMSEDREQCLQAGCDDFLSKPIDWLQLNKLLDPS